MQSDPLSRLCRAIVLHGGILTALLALALPMFAGSSPSQEQRGWLRSWREKNPVWRGLHLAVENDTTADKLDEQIPALAKLGVNVIITEVNYGLAFDSHPDLRSGRPLGKLRAKALAASARKQGIRLIPQFSCLGHQSWARITFPLLTKHPEFDETPGQFPDNTNIYCRSWCPQNPEVNKVVFALIDDMIEAFDADAFHVGMDEVFIIASEHCPRCKGGDPAKLFAKAVNDLHDHIVGDRKLEMLMWGDRFLEAKTMGYGKWESAENGTHGAVDLIPKDIVMCDWHYEKRVSYLSIPFFIEKGIRVWPAGWRDTNAVNQLIDYSEKHRDKLMLGYLATTWGAARGTNLSEWPPLVTGMERFQPTANPPGK